MSRRAWACVTVVAASFAVSCSGHAPLPPEAGNPRPTGTPASPAPPSSTASVTPPLDREPPASAARHIATTFFAPDYRNVDRYVDDVRTVTTGTFRDDFVAKKQELVRLLTDARSVATSSVTAAASRDETADQAEVLVSVDQRITNIKSSGPKTTRYRIRMHLLAQGSTWVADQLEPVIDVAAAPCSDAGATPRGAAALTAACEANVTLFALQSNEDQATSHARVAAVTTGAFREEAVGLLDNPVVRNSHASVAPRVLQAALVDVEPDHASVLVFFDEAVTRPAMEPRVDRQRAIMNMTLVDDRWLVSGVDVL